MTEENPREDILVAGLDDWVSLAEAQGYVRDALPQSDQNELRRATIDLIEQMVIEDLLEVGQLMPRFVPWAISPEQSVEKLRSEWIVTTTVESDHGFDWWLNLTPTGRQTASAVDNQRREG